MNFFEQQDRARRRTGWLVGLFALAVASLVAMTQLLLMALFHFGGQTPLTRPADFWTALPWPVMVEIAAAIVLVVSAASFYKLRQLRSGGSAVAALLGGRLLDRTTQQPDERKLLNVVEEMAIAAGVPVPPVYVLEETSINAFAAGHDSTDVAIGITRGAIELLSRDELQGVIAHEFSHIFNGDMRLNLQLMGWLHGILFLGLIGRFLLDTLGRGRSRGRDNRGAGIAILLGLGLVIIGWCGTFFGKLIKAGISRQREFLADASAVQFTRNPDGIAWALKKIGACPAGSLITHRHAAQASHLFFGCGLDGLSGLFATHPPLEDRIRAIDRHWDGQFPALDTGQLSAGKPAMDPTHVHIINGEVVYAPPATAAMVAGVGAVAAAIDSAGAPRAEHVTAAREALATLPEQLQQLARETWGASTLVHCLLASHPVDQWQQQRTLLQSLATGSVHTLCDQIIGTVQILPPSLRLPLLDLCLPSLKLLSTRQRHQFLQVITRQIQLDQQVSLFEWALYRLLKHHLDDKPASGKTLGLPELAGSIHTVMSALALANHDNPANAAAAFGRGWAGLGLATMTPSTTALQQMAALDLAVRQLSRLQPLAKPRLLKAFAATIAMPDGTCPVASYELLRAIADTIDTPMPPLVIESAGA